MIRFSIRESMLVVGSPSVGQSTAICYPSKLSISNTLTRPSRTKSGCCQQTCAHVFTQEELRDIRKEWEKKWLSDQCLSNELPR